MPKIKASPAITVAQRPDGYIEVQVDGYIEVQVDGYTKFITRDPASAQTVAKSFAPPPPRDDATLSRALR